MSKKSEGTGLGPTVLVAIEQNFEKDKRGIEDPYAEKILPLPMKLFVKTMNFNFMRNWLVKSSEKSLPGIWAGMICRKKYFDDVVVNSKEDVQNIVNLGAGYDTRFYRLYGLEHLSLFEIDQPNNIDSKVSLMKENLEKIPENINYIKVDFDKEDTLERLIESGLDTSQRTLFLLEGVTQYLTEKGFLSILEMIEKFPKGSSLAFTYVLKDLIEGKKLYGFEKGYEKYVEKEKIWKLGYNKDEIKPLLEKYELEINEDKSFVELGEKYVEPLNRNLKSTEIERVAFAVKK